MSRIRVLPGEVVKKIAAGEVIEGPHSVVKELLENAIDAGATEILVEVEEGGKRRITVRDNGCGMGREDLMLAFQSHTTSKISKISDLVEIKTFGFRGEALASIAAVSRVEAMSRENPLFFEKAEEEGTRVLIEEGRILKVEGVGHPPGTTIHVRDLFFNIPVRRKGLKSSAVEGSRVLDVVRPIALSHPNITFRTILDGEEVFSLRGGEPLLQRLGGIFGARVRKEMFYLKRRRYGWGEVEGYLSLPDYCKRSSKDLYIIVNGRWVKNEEIGEAVRGGYGRILMKGKHPYGVIVLRIDGRLVDVNIHPQKLKVKILDAGRIMEDLEEAIREDLQETAPPPGNLSLSEEVVMGRLPEVTDVEGGGGVKVRGSKQVTLPAGWGAGGGVLERTLPLPSSLLKPVERLRGGEISIIGQFKERYVLLEYDDELVILDQHAAHERIRLEEGERHFEVGGKVLELLKPLYIELPPGRVRELEGRWEELERLGISAEPFGEEKVVVRTLPAFIRPSEAKEILRDFLEGYGGRILAEERERLIDNYACKGAIKSGERLTEVQIKDLVNNLFRCRDPYHCAHGRPTMLKISMKDLDKSFHRTG